MNNNNNNNPAHFAEAFWSEEFTSTAGFEAVNKRMKDGTQTCKCLVNFFRQRAKLEDEYTKGLQRIVKNTEYTEIGKLREGLESLRLLGDKTSEEHQSASKTFLECAERIETFAEKQKSERRTEKDKVEKIIKDKQKIFDKMTSAMKSYHQKSQDVETAEQNIVKATANIAKNPKDLDKANKNKEKAISDAEKADNAYKEQIKLLDEVRIVWEKELDNYFQFCEEQEKLRISTLLNEMWAHSNIVSLSCVSVDENCESARQTLEQIRPDSDIAEFVSANQLGCMKPAPIVYESYNKQSTRSGSLRAQPAHHPPDTQPPSPQQPEPQLPTPPLAKSSLIGRPVPMPRVVGDQGPPVSPPGTVGRNRVMISNGVPTSPTQTFRPSAMINIKPPPGSGKN